MQQHLFWMMAAASAFGDRSMQQAAQVALASSDAVPSPGRFALAFKAQQDAEFERIRSEQQIGTELARFLRKQELTPEHLKEYPSLARLVARFLPSNGAHEHREPHGAHPHT